MIDLGGHASQFCAAVLAAAGAGLLLNARDGLGLLRRIAGPVWAALAATIVAAFMTRAFLVPHRSYVFNDEYEHAAIAQNLRESGRFSRCEFYLDGRCLSSYLPQWVPGFHFSLARTSGIFGTGLEAAYNFNAVVGAASVAAIFLTAYLITGDSFVALTAALLLCFSPLHLKFSGNASTEAFSFLSVTLSMAAALSCFRLRTSRSLWLFLAASAWALLVRPENGLAVAFQASLLMRGRSRAGFLSWGLFLVLLVPGLLYLPHIADVALETHGDGGHVQGWLLLLRSLRFWSDGRAVPAVVVLLAAAGWRWAVKEESVPSWWWPSYFLSFLFLYTFINRGDLSNRDFQRNNLQLILPVVLLAALGCRGALLAAQKMRHGRLAAGAVLLTLLAGHAAGLPYVSDDIADPHWSRERDALAAGASVVDPACVFVTYSPSTVIAILNRSSVNISYMSNEEVLARELRNRCLVLVRDETCRQDRGGLCAALGRRFRLQPIRLPRERSGEELLYFITARDLRR